MSDQEKPSLPPEFSPEEAEIARQLFSLRQSPGVELQRRIEAIPQPPARPAGVTPRPLLGGLAALLVAALLFISPPVQATLDEVQKMMGQIPVIVRTVWPQPVEAVVTLETEAMSLGCRWGEGTSRSRPVASWRSTPGESKRASRAASSTSEP